MCWGWNLGGWWDFDMGGGLRDGGIERYDGFAIWYADNVPKSSAVWMGVATANDSSGHGL